MGILDVLFGKSKAQPDCDNTIETECEKLAIRSREAFKTGNKVASDRLALQVLNSINNDTAQIDKINDTSSVALALGALMEGEYITENEDIKRAVGLTYYFLCRAINESKSPDPYLYVYRFSTVWEYNKTFYHLFAHAEGTEYDFSPFDIMSQVSTMTYNHHMAGMQMADALTEPKVLQLDPALRNIFYETYEQYRNTPSEQIISLGNQYHEQVYTYLADKISREDFDF